MGHTQLLIRREPPAHWYLANFVRTKSTADFGARGARAGFAMC